METKVPEKPVCPICKRKTIYFRANGTVKCRGCGYDGKLEGDLK
jgi:ribosomal protein L37AE/L43A